MVKNIILSFNAHLYYNKAWLERMDSMPDFIVTPFAFEDLAKVKAHGADSVLIGTPFFSARCVYALSLIHICLVKQRILFFFIGCLKKSLIVIKDFILSLSKLR